ncbi:MAG: MFS transporter [Candidatus Latescibacterota bacterium]
MNPPHTPAKAHLGALIMAWMFLFGLIGAALIGPNRLSIERTFDLSHETFGTAFALIQIICSVSVLAVATRLKRLNNLNALIISLFIQIIGFIILYLAPNAIVLALGWTCVTLGIVMGSVCNTISADLWTDNPARGVTLLHGFNGIGKVAGPLIAAYCLLIGWRLSFLAVAAITLIILLAFYYYKKCHTHPEPPKQTFHNHIFKSPTYWLCILPFGLIAGGDVAFAALVPLYYETVHHYTAQNASLLLTFHLFGLVVGRFIFAYLSGRISNNTIIGICLIFGFAIFLAIQETSLTIHLVGLFGIGVLYSSTWATFYAQATRFIPPQASHLLDFGTAFGNALGIAVCVYLSSVIADMNLDWAMIFCVAVLWLFGLVYYLSPLSRQNAKPIEL